MPVQTRSWHRQRHLSAQPLSSRRARQQHQCSSAMRSPPQRPHWLRPSLCLYAWCRRLAVRHPRRAPRPPGQPPPQTHRVQLRRLQRMCHARRRRLRRLRSARQCGQRALRLLVAPSHRVLRIRWKAPRKLHEQAAWARRLHPPCRNQRQSEQLTSARAALGPALRRGKRSALRVSKTGRSALRSALHPRQLALSGTVQATCAGLASPWHSRARWRSARGQAQQL